MWPRELPLRLLRVCPWEDCVMARTSSSGARRSAGSSAPRRSPWRVLVDRRRFTEDVEDEELVRVQLAFREANEQRQTFPLPERDGGLLELVCECSNAECAKTV